MKLSKTAILLILLCLVSFLSHLLYILVSHQYPVWDEHHYVGLAVRYYDFLRTDGILGFLDIFRFQTNRQPLYPLLITILLLFTGTAHTYWIALFLNGIFLSLSILGVSALARHFLSRSSSLIAAFLFATYGNVLFYSHFSYVETAVTTAIVWALVALVKTDHFMNRRWSIMAGVLTAIATLTRFIAPVFIIGPALILSLRGSRRNIFLFTLISFLIPLLLYFLPSRNVFMIYVKNNQTQGAQWVRLYRDPEMADTHSIRSVMFYFNIISQNTIVMFVLFAGGVLLAMKNLRKYSFLLLAFFVPYAFLTFITTWKEDRFMVSIYPAMAMLSAVFIEKISRFRRLSVTVITIIIVIGSLNYVAALWGLGPMGQRGLLDYVTPRWVPHPRRVYLTPIVWPPQKELVNAHLLVNAIQHDWGGKTKAEILLDVKNDMFLNAVEAIITFEKRNVLEIISPEATAAGEVDYIATQSKNNEFGTLLTSFTIPADESMVYVYKTKRKIL